MEDVLGLTFLSVLKGRTVLTCHIETYDDYDAYDAYDACDAWDAYDAYAAYAA